MDYISCGGGLFVIAVLVCLGVLIFGYVSIVSLVGDLVIDVVWIIFCLC